MTTTPDPPVLDDVVIAGDRLRPRGLWLPLQEVQQRRAAAGWPGDLAPDVRARAERILPGVRQRALGAALRAAHAHLPAPPAGPPVDDAGDDDSR
ncbi:hypothetical protein QWY84_18940 [Aquisalimonas lutea]|uniref:hypothetical protein n=1 Tax=Aquisalimonas lutea TaxID=1327750 RepID=UPI0025B4D4AB|nr:hypothetical protein [Aquisalimonas lutea]MDN3519690.1 hypothetical protein [Aquisalimonas lutea]